MTGKVVMGTQAPPTSPTAAPHWYGLQKGPWHGDDPNDSMDDIPEEPEERWPETVPPQVKAARTRLEAMKQYQVDDYDMAESDIHKQLLLATSKTQYLLEQASTWVLSVLVGVINGCLGAAFNLCINALNRWKYDSVQRYLEPEGSWTTPFLVMMSFSVLYSSFAGFLGSYFSPQAAGSGIPEIRAYLNGVHIRNLLSIRTLVAKSLGVSFAIASGLVAGKEGPFIHIGAIIGAGVSKMGSQSVTRWTNGALRARLRRSLGSYFRQPVQTRDYVAAGAAAGIATAFGAPIGGILFAVEQGSSWFSTRMLWHAVVAAGTALYVTEVLLVTDAHPSSVGSTRIAQPLEFVLKKDVSARTQQYFYTPWEIVIHILMGVVAGLMGALLVFMNKYVVEYRIRWVKRNQPFRRLMEVVLLAAAATTIWFALSFNSPCKIRPAMTADENTLSTGAPVLPTLWCSNPDEYSAWGALFFTPLSGAVTRLYYALWDDKYGDELVFSNTGLVMLMFLTFFFIPFTYGSGAASGIFVPSLLCGACAGRLVGNGVSGLMSTLGVAPTHLAISLQSYAVIGSGAMLGGVTRMLLSSCVLIMETSGANPLVVPLIIAATVAKIVADALAPGIYDTSLVRGAYPFLPAEAESLKQIKQQQQLAVADVMTYEPVVMPAIIRIRDLIHMLRSNTFSTFPLVHPTAAAAPRHALGPAGSSGVSSGSFGPSTGNQGSATSVAAMATRRQHATGAEPSVSSSAEGQYTGRRFVASNGLPTILSVGAGLNQEAGTSTSGSEPHDGHQVADSGGLQTLDTSKGGPLGEGLEHGSITDVAQPRRGRFEGGLEPAGEALGRQGTAGAAALPPRPPRSGVQSNIHGRSVSPFSAVSNSPDAPGVLASSCSPAPVSLIHSSTSPQPVSVHLTIAIQRRSAHARDTSGGDESGAGSSSATTASTPRSAPLGPAQARGWAAVNMRIAAAANTVLTRTSSTNVGNQMTGAVHSHSTEDRSVGRSPSVSPAPGAGDTSGRPAGEAGAAGRGRPAGDRSGLYIPKLARLSVDPLPRHGSPPHATLSTTSMKLSVKRTASGQVPPNFQYLPQVSPTFLQHATTAPSPFSMPSPSDPEAESAAAQETDIHKVSNGLPQHPSAPGNGTFKRAHPELLGLNSLKTAAHDKRGHHVQHTTLLSPGAGSHLASSHLNHYSWAAGAAGGAASLADTTQEISIVGVISRQTLLKILQIREGFCTSRAEAHGAAGTPAAGVLGFPATRVVEAVRKFDLSHLKPPTTQEGQDRLFNSLSDAELDSFINLRHYMQRVPYTLPANASLARAYRLFRTLGLHHILVTTGNAPVVGMLTRSDLVPDRADIAMYEKLDASLAAANKANRRKSFMEYLPQSLQLQKMLSALPSQLTHLSKAFLAKPTEQQQAAASGAQDGPVGGEAGGEHVGHVTGNGFGAHGHVDGEYVHGEELPSLSYGIAPGRVDSGQYDDAHAYLSDLSAPHHYPPHLPVQHSAKPLEVPPPIAEAAQHNTYTITPGEGAEAWHPAPPTIAQEGAQVQSDLGAARAASPGSSVTVHMGSDAHHLPPVQLPMTAAPTLGVDIPTPPVQGHPQAHASVSPPAREPWASTAAQRVHRSVEPSSSSPQQHRRGQQLEELMQELEVQNTRGVLVDELLLGTYQPVVQDEMEVLSHEAQSHGIPLMSARGPGVAPPWLHAGPSSDDLTEFSALEGTSPPAGGQFEHQASPDQMHRGML